jgi:ribosome modulation factor
MMTKVKYVSDEYHEGQTAYINGQALTTNPYLEDATASKGGMWYWMFGWQDAMATDVQGLKRLILTIVEPTEKKDIN